MTATEQSFVFTTEIITNMQHQINEAGYSFGLNIDVVSPSPYGCEHTGWGIPCSALQKLMPMDNRSTRIRKAQLINAIENNEKLQCKIILVINLNVVVPQGGKQHFHILFEVTLITASRV